MRAISEACAGGLLHRLREGRTSSDGSPFAPSADLDFDWLVGVSLRQQVCGRPLIGVERLSHGGREPDVAGRLPAFRPYVLSHR